MGERATNGVYALAPGATAWRLVAPRPAPNRGVQAAAWDEAGHLTALWGMSADPQRTGLVVFHLR